MHHNKTLITIFFLFVFCYSGMRSIVPFFNYAINYSYIAEVLCINKENEVLKCNGKCQLTKEILENEREGTSEYPQPIFEKLTTLFLENQEFPEWQKLSYTTKPVFNNPKDFYNNNFNKPLLPPPKMCFISSTIHSVALND